MSRVALRRAGTMGAVLLLCLAAIGVRLGYVQAVRSEAYAAEARKQRVRNITLPARRGAIYDRYGGQLAVSIPSRTVYANPKLIADPAAIARTLAPLLQRNAVPVEADLRKSTSFVYLARRIGLVTAKKIEELKLPGIGVVDEPRRLYPNENLASAVVGFIGTDQKGLAGIEFGYDKLLGGRPGWRVLEQDPRGRRIPQGVFTEQPPVPGSDVMLTIDPDLQLSTEAALQRAVEKTRANGGMAVALDPRTGEIFAMANNPTFDPNVIENLDQQVIKNRAVTDAYEPGSVSKIITASAALAEGAIKPDEQMWVPYSIQIADRTFIEEKHGARSLDLRGILAQSSNLGTIRLAQELGADKLDEYFKLFGYGKPTGLGFPGESAGMLPSAGRWATSLPTMAIGQGLSVTPLQIAQAFATIANDGVVVEPRLVSGWVDPQGDIHRTPGARRHRVIPKQVASTVRDMLGTVVAEGTGTLAQIPGYAVAGKTGTARRLKEGVGYSGHIASFVGMFPASAPRLVIAIILDNAVPIEGGLAAAPAFAEIGKEAVRILRIPPGA
jgi:cell division protein FtsI (penicillin-binding protein 3)